LRAPFLVSSKSYSKMSCIAVVLIAFFLLESLKNLNHFGLCGACSCSIQCTVTSDVIDDTLEGIATTFPTLGKLPLLDAVAISIPTRKCFTMSWFWITVLLEVPMYILKRKGKVWNSQVQEQFLHPDRPFQKSSLQVWFNTGGIQLECRNHALPKLVLHSSWIPPVLNHTCNVAGQNVGTVPTQLHTLRLFELRKLCSLHFKWVLQV